MKTQDPLAESVFHGMLCRRLTPMLGTEKCDPCWEVAHREDVVALLVGVPLGIIAFFRWVLERCSHRMAHEAECPVDTPIIGCPHCEDNI